MQNAQEEKRVISAYMVRRFYGEKFDMGLNKKNLDSPSAERARGAGADAFDAGKSLWKRFSASCSARIREVELATETCKNYQRIMMNYY